MNLRVDIGRLVFDGIDVPIAERPALRAAVEAELGRLLIAAPAPALAAGGAVPGVRGGDVHLGGPAPELGGRIAHAVHEGLAR
jgi:hypothetical protein